MKKLHLLALGAVIMLGLSGCEKATVVSQATADAFIKSIKNPKDTSQTVYAVIHSVFSYNLIASASVVSPDGTTMQLTDFTKQGNSFYNAPADSTFSSTIPSIGTYNYTVTFKDGEVLTYSNTLSSSTLLPPSFTSLTKSVHGDSVYIAWNAVTNAQAYQLKITQGTTQIYYIPPFTIAGTTPRVGFPLSILLVNVSGTFTFELDDMLFETTDLTYLQAVGVSKKDIAL